jgi:hypothetical protein
MKEEKTIIEFQTIEGVNIEMIKRNHKYYILVSEDKKKIKRKKVFESLDDNKTQSRFFKICNYFTKEINS